MNFLLHYMKNLKRILMSVLFSGAIGISTVSAQNIDSTLHLPVLLNLAMQNNPRLQASNERYLGAHASIGPVSTLPDPQIMVGVMSLPVDMYRLDTEPMTQKTVGVTQVLPFFGKLGMQKQIAQKESHSAQAETEMIRLEILNEVKKTFYGIYRIDKTLDILVQNKILLENLAAISRSEYRVGRGTQLELLKSQTELIKIETELIEQHQDRLRFSVRLNSLINRPVNDPVGKVADLQMPDLHLVLDTLKQAALNKNPRLVSRGIRLEQNKTVHRLARREYWPDLMVSVNYGFRDAYPDLISGTLAFNLPVFAATKQSRQVEATAVAIQEAEFDLLDQKNEILAQVEITFQEVEQDKKIISLYLNEILPRSRQSFESALSAYKTDQVQFLTVLEHQIQYVQYQLKYHQLISRYFMAITDLEALCAMDFI